MPFKIHFSTIQFTDVFSAENRCTHPYLDPRHVIFDPELFQRAFHFHFLMINTGLSHYLPTTVYRTALISVINTFCPAMTIRGPDNRREG